MNSSSYLVLKYTQMGFTEANISKAIQQSGGNESTLLDILCSMSEEGTQSPQKQLNKDYDSKVQNQQISTVEEASPIHNVHVIDRKKSMYPLNPEERLRKNGFAVGLKNIGNTCYVNSLLQTYFMSQKFVSAILSYNPHVHLVEEGTPSVLSISLSNLKSRRIEASIELVKSLQKLFALMIKSHKRFLDPNEVICCVVDEMGKCLALGEQKDVTEYHLNFLSRIEEAFAYQEKYLKANKRFDRPPSPEKSIKSSWFHGALIKSYFAPEKPIPKHPDELQDINDESIEWIKKHFYGVMKEYTSIEDEVIQEREFIFGPIILDISNNRDLYESLEKYCNITIDDFRDQLGQTTQAKQKLWISEAPEFLVFQLNRVSFDPNTRKVYKINKEFEFQKEIFLDRYMVGNKDEATKINQSINALKKELGQNEVKLQKIINCMSRIYIAPEILGNTENFVSPQSSSAQLATENCSQSEVETATKVLRVYMESLEKQAGKIKNHISEIKVKISELSESLKQYKYHLASILIHAGEAGRGHYYSFGRNFGNDTWSRFDDTQVKPEKEENVWKEASGKIANINAYCLIYLADNRVQEEFTTILMSLAKSTVNNEILVERHHYSDMVPESLLEYVKEDNYAFYKRIEAYRFNKNLDLAIELYKQKYDIIERVILRNSKALPNYLDSFAMFLKSELYDEFLLKWHILDTSLKETECCLKLRELNSPQLISQIQNKVAVLPKSYSLTHITLTSNEKGELDKKLGQYLVHYPVMVCYRLLIKSFINEEWKDACYIACRILFVEHQRKKKYSNLTKILTQVICLKLVIKAESEIIKGDLKATVYLMGFLTVLGKGILKQTDIHVSQIKAILSDALDQAQQSLLANDLNAMKQEVYRFSSGIHQSSELSKIIKDYLPSNLEKEMEPPSSEDLYKWKDVENGGISYEVSKSADKFSEQNQLYVELQKILEAQQKVLSLEERKENGFFIKENL